VLGQRADCTQTKASCSWVNLIDIFPEAW